MMSETQRDGVVSRSELGATRVALRLFVPAVATSLAILVIGVIAALYLLTSQNKNSEILAVEVASIRAAEEMAVMVRQAEIQYHRYLVTGDAQNLEPIGGYKRKSDRLLDIVRSLGRTDRERAILAELDQVEPEFWSEMLTDPQLDETQHTARRYQLADALVGTLNEYVGVNNDLVQQATRENEQLAARLAISLMALGIVGSALGLFMGYAIARRIRQSIVRLSLSIHDTAGKLDDALLPITISTEPNAEKLEEAAQRVSDRVETIVEQLAVSQRERLRAEQLATLGRLSAGLAHELRNPMASMKLIIQNAQERGMSLGERHLTILDDEIRRIERLIRSFLDFARPPKLERDRFDLAAVCRQKLELVSGRLKLKNLDLDTNLPNTPLLVEADQGQIRQLLLNLLINAIDASPEFGRIRVRVEPTPPPPEAPPDDARSWVAIEVSDSGPGLPPVSMDMLFEPFYSTKQEGVGLGLPISKQIVEAHGGIISASTLASGGASFLVYLPIAT